ncbi:death effector domain-containing protein-like [Ruditapes philippinarum]|uniref:death effector domain-containing protein-like n=1 Tax=Ruditapes philippinarum TaxID=129788 RepID=UPI00295A6040|nr:death effector domain-containing protein-like [Ruditapes philippinarum]
MASPMDRCKKVNNNLHKMFDILETNMNSTDTERFKTQVLLSGVFGEFWKRNRASQIPRKMYKCDAFTFLRFLESKGYIDETNTKIVQNTIKSVKPELKELVTTEASRLVEVDPVVDYLEKTAPLQPSEFTYHRPIPGFPTRRSERIRKRICTDEVMEFLEMRRKKEMRRLPPTTDQTCSSSTSYNSLHNHQIQSCDVRLRVKVEYEDHRTVLGNSVHSHKQHEIERQFEKFNQACAILKSRDLGTVVCDIKFSELTSLDAFWRDYTNGALLEALKVVFITESLNEAVGHEALCLLVSVDEEDYRKGRLKLLKNLTD